MRFSTSQFRSATFQVLDDQIWLVLDSADLGQCKGEGALFK